MTWNPFQTNRDLVWGMLVRFFERKPAQHLFLNLFTASLSYFLLETDWLYGCTKQ